MRHVATTALLAVAAVLATRVAASEPVDDAFTYQGKLTDNNAPADGLYDFSFTLHEVASGAGALVLGPVQVEDVPVENGVFSVRIDFGAGAFSGDRAGWESACAIMARPASSKPSRAARNSPQRPMRCMH